jgi:hypothetical protein
VDSLTLYSAHHGNARYLPPPSRIRELHRAWLVTIHGQRTGHAPEMVLRQSSRSDPFAVILTQHHHMVQPLAADAPDEPFH